MYLVINEKKIKYGGFDMFIVIAKTASLYGVIDTEDLVVDWFDATTLREYATELNIEIHGVTKTGEIYVNQAYYMPFYEVKLNRVSMDIFSMTTAIRSGVRGVVEFAVAQKLYKMRLLIKTPVQMGKSYMIGDRKLIAEMDGHLVKLSNGICTILPPNVFSKFANYFK